MYFPEDMTFQYFFFDTYIGYFLQALPIALIVSAVYGFIRFKKDKEIIAEYESQVKGTDGSGCLAPFVCFLVIVLRELRF